MKVFKVLLCSTAYHIGVFLLTVAFSIIGVIILPLTRKVRYRIIRNWAKFTLSVGYILPADCWEVDGIENIPKNTGSRFRKTSICLGNISPTISVSRTITSYKTRAVISTVFRMGTCEFKPDFNKP